MKTSGQCIEESKKQLSALGKIESRTQFGGYSLSVEKVVFALVSEGDLYLRASEKMQSYLQHRRLQPFIFHKRGQCVSLNYYKVDPLLWQQSEALLELSHSSLKEARALRESQLSRQRLKDLPNLSVRLEILLKEAGITSVSHLRATGARQSWTLLRKKNKHLGLKTLYALQGAIFGQHQEVLSAGVKEELKHWYLQFEQTTARSACKRNNDL
ncbi:TfoX/Sxy family DNA transformation protein [Tatumella sp. JGM118]|uniref:TfoX/Sxy family DNA transformation protein n=1 Tax=Tatumella sp. JGM118 TaxID=2799796 RepID=UPI001BAFC0ED|nr:TfoX/Sxy family DNA transformation protein [Tatumella sp. JGM118]MBS0907916.1 TfoX/Sxy family DNA transformation protein [Tatumella sp. JGM118]